MIGILLATYNSERFLREQLDSLLGQTYNDFIVYVRDDGSSDRTLDIIEEYSARCPNIKLLNDPVKHRRAAGSFMWLLEQVDADYYMFCDHDDVWLPNKIAVTLQKMEEAEKVYSNQPILVHSDLKVVDSDLKLIHPSFWKRTRLIPHILRKFNYIGVCNCVTGCTVMFNKRVKQYVLPYDEKAPMHDWWVAALVAKYGKIVCVPEATILYRQHLQNVVGARDISRSYFLNRLFHFLKTIKEHQQLFPFHKAIGYGGVVKYYWYKFLYTVRRNL